MNGYKPTLVFTIAILAGLCECSTATAQPLFPIPRIIAVNSMIDAQFADFDLDGIPDHVVGSFTEEGVHVLRGVGDGTFTPWAFLPVPLTRGLRVRDINNDQRPDLVILSDDELIVYLTESDGTFTPLAPVATEVGALQEFGLGDFDGDQELDLLYIYYIPEPPYESWVVTRLGNGDGTFGSELRIEVDVIYTHASIADFDEDGLDDLVLSTDSIEVFELWRSLSGAEWATPVVLSDLPNPSRSVAADFDGDDHIDIILTHSSPLSTQISRGNGDGTFDPPTLLGAFSNYVMEAADVDQDGDPDLIYSSFRSVSVLLNLGSLTFGPGLEFYAQGLYPHVADLNQDGVQDLAVSRSDGTDLFLSSDQGYRVAETLDGPDRNVIDVASGNIDSDSMDDVAIIVSETDEVALYRGQGGTLEWIDSIPIPTGSVELALVDVFGSGLSDLIVISEGSDLLTLWTNTGGMPAYTTSESFSVGPGPTSLDIADVDNDGDLDFIVALTFSGAVRVLFNTASGFQVGPALPSSSGARGVAAADLNGDGTIDLAVTGDLGLYVHYGFGDGTYASPLAPVSMETRFVAAGDIDSDGTAELFATTLTDSILELRSTGLVGFDIEERPTLDRAGQIDLADVTGDGILDLVLDNSFLDTLSVYRGNSDGSLSEPKHYLGYDPTRFAVGDVNGDGRLDLVTARKSFFLDDVIRVLFNQPGGAAPITFVRGDANQDGAFDIADVVAILDALFSASAMTNCADATDVNDDGSPNVADAVFALSAIFSAGSSPPAPFPACGEDPTPDLLGCRAHAACP